MAVTATMPPTLQDGGFGKLRERLQDPVVRQQTIKDMNSKTDQWENFFYAVGTPENILVVGFKQDSLKKYIGKSLAAVAKLRGKSAEETATVQAEIILGPEDVKHTKQDYLLWERELMGLYLSDHPLGAYEAFLREKTNPIGDITKDDDGKKASIGGIINGVRVIQTKKVFNSK